MNNMSIMAFAVAGADMATQVRLAGADKTRLATGKTGGEACFKGLSP